MDFSPLYDQFWSGKAQTDATMQGVLEWCIQEMRVIGADLQWIARARNMVNVMTECALPGFSTFDRAAAAVEQHLRLHVTTVSLGKSI
uniref:Uncharacterized protein n=1 Tax=Chromera velia CCMP2878 TaxID=1169474 RepID=A0A0G4I418_9ALVE|eukprot:Cvel_10771.t1-p1 / transcript=Cvel_10771.t1 / gene=Cvel_10771 / organism=Chromera_velia_CCMP2878 / gene_product=hypothetical protein / transcript_product=hypothetical protein / location=Cvel_scaffold658:12651-17378(-) / protein_length=87 / sequence_SO=supercontig / SO=protein_coding / is_pseudo=false